VEMRDATGEETESGARGTPRTRAGG
jgi:hypothetical protein